MCIVWIFAKSWLLFELADWVLISLLPILIDTNNFDFIGKVKLPVSDFVYSKLDVRKELLKSLIELLFKF